MEYRPVASWLRSNRLRQTRENGEPWTQDFLLERMAEDLGWAPARPNYSRYESGRATPNRETLGKLIRFWERYGEPTPDLTPPAPPAEPVDPMAALVEQLIEEQRQTRAMLSVVLMRLGGQPIEPDPGLVAEMLAELYRVAPEAVAKVIADRPPAGSLAR